MPNSEQVSPQLSRIAQLAKEAKDLSFKSLNHYLNTELLTASFMKLNRKASAGVDGRDWDEYEAKLPENLQDLIGRVKTGTYRASPVKRVYIPKGGNAHEKRPLGVPIIEDKTLQRGVASILEAIYEQDFLDCSYGFRPGRSAHDCIRAIRETLQDQGGGFIIDADISKFFDSIDRTQLQDFLSIRIADSVLRRTIGKWLNAGVLDNGELSYPLAGTPQGGCISPCLANVYLHYVLDTWIAELVASGCYFRGSIRLYRYADDFLIVCKDQNDATRLLEALGKRLQRFKLTLHPDKTRLVDFTQEGKETFSFLGFQFYWGKSKKKRAIVKVQTDSKRLSASAKKMWQLCKEMRHEPIKAQRVRLARILVGYGCYYGVTFNSRRLRSFHKLVEDAWRYWLNRRSQRRGHMPWERMRQILLSKFPLPVARLRISLLS